MTIKVKLQGNEAFAHEAAYATPTEDGNWLNILDDDGLSVAMYPKDKVVGVFFLKAGEAAVTSEDTKRPS